ncbi:MAG: hypothetical protein ACI4ES_02050, partial [Roseburia sp.]
MEKNEKTDRLQEAGILFLSVLMGGVSSFLYGDTLYETVKIVILIVIMAGGIVFAIEECRIQDSFLFDNNENMWRFTILYLLFLVVSVIFPMLPAGGWPYLAVYVGLMLFSNQLISMCAGSTLLMISVLLSEAPPDIFVIYFVCGIIGILLFSGLDESFRVGLPLMISLLIQVVCLCLHDVLMVNEVLNAEMFMIPAVNILVSL